MLLRLFPGWDILLSDPRPNLVMEVRMGKENSSKLGWIGAAVLGVMAWFLGGIVSAGTGLKKRR